MIECKKCGSFYSPSLYFQCPYCNVSPVRESVYDKQVGGDHYKNTKFQAIEVIRDWDLGFEAGSAIKYIARHKKKGDPIKDIEKAIHYLEMYLEDLKHNIKE